MTSHERINQLMQRFPFFYARIPSGLKKEFDGSVLDNWAVNTGISTSEFIVATFILMVWDRKGKWEAGSFLIDEAVDILDNDNYAVIKEWVNKPFFL